MPRVIRAALMAGAACVVAAATPAAMRAQGSLAITHARLIDGNGGVPVADATVVITGGRIAAVGPAASVRVPGGARVIDAAGKVVMPGLADLHVHLTGGWDGETTDLLGYPRYLDALLYAGVTTAMDVGNVLPYVQQLRREIAAGRLVGPRLYMAGALIDGVAWLATGSRSVIVDPTPISLSISMVAPIKSAKLFTMDRPRPVPPNCRRMKLSPCSNGSKILFRRSAGMPMPVSRTMISRG